MIDIIINIMTGIIIYMLDILVKPVFVCITSSMLDISVNITLGIRIAMKGRIAVIVEA